MERITYRAKKVHDLRELKPGQHIRSAGVIYNHHMMVVRVISSSRIRVIHYTGRDGNTTDGIPGTSQNAAVATGFGSVAAGFSSGSGSLLGGIAEVIEEDITIDLAKQVIQLLEYPDGEDIHQGEEAIKRAQSKLTEADYHLFSNNCESLINWAIVGKHTTNQGEWAEFGIKVAAGFGVLAAIGFGIGAAISGRGKDEDDEDD